MRQQEFEQQARDLCRSLRSINGEAELLLDWQLEYLGETCYLVHPVVLKEHLAPCWTTNENENDEEFEDDSVLGDEVTIERGQRKNSSQRSFEWRFSIVYSETWSLPVLYFTVQDSSGCPCPRETLLSSLPSSTGAEDTWDVVSYDEHPVTRTPSYFLHPCQTEARLDLLVGSNDTKWKPSFLLSWLSLILPAVGFGLPSHTFQALCQSSHCDLE